MRATIDIEPTPGFVLVVHQAKSGRSCLSALPPGPRTVVVTVREVLLAPSLFSGLEGQRVTLLYPEPAKRVFGGAFTVAAAGWLYGEALGLRVLKEWRGPTESREARAVAMAVAASTSAVSPRRKVRR
jgi:hypothetical protein